MAAPAPVEIDILDMTSRGIMSQRMEGSTEMQLSLETLPNGIYTARLLQGKTQYIQKIILQK
jgi:hypothetical protein